MKIEFNPNLIDWDNSFKDKTLPKLKTSVSNEKKVFQLFSPSKKYKTVPKKEYNKLTNNSNEAILAFRRLLKDKSVAFVGMGSNIKGKGLGKEIDGFDIVFRTNMFPIPEELQDDYGTRCDIIMLQKNYHKLMKQFVASGIKYYVSAFEMPEIRNTNRLVIKTGKKLKIARYMNKFIDDDCRVPTAGLVSYFLCMILECSRFKFFGITGYQNINHEIVDHNLDENNEYKENHYNKEYVQFWTKVSPSFKNNSLATDMNNNQSHDYMAQNNFLAVALNQKVVEMDQYSLPYFSSLKANIINKQNINYE